MGVSALGIGGAGCGRREKGAEFQKLRKPHRQSKLPKLRNIRQQGPEVSEWLVMRAMVPFQPFAGTNSGLGHLVRCHSSR
jgi:hypothetical protein